MRFAGSLIACLICLMAAITTACAMPVQTLPSTAGIAAGLDETSPDSGDRGAGATSASADVDPEVAEMNRVRLQRAAAGHPIPPVSPWTAGLLTVYCGLIVTASVVGGLLPSWIELTHTRMQTVISFVGGLMLGIGVFHLLPHSTHSLPSIDSCVRWMMAGMIAMFLLIRTFHFHHHGPLEISPNAVPGRSSRPLK